MRRKRSLFFAILGAVELSLVLWVSLTIPAAYPEIHAWRSGALEVSFGELVNHPRAYNGKLVKVLGWCHFGFEENALYLGPAEYIDGQYDQALWLTLGLPAPAPRQYQGFSNAYVTVEGVFDVNEPRELYAGVLQDIRVVRLELPRLLPIPYRVEVP